MDDVRTEELILLNYLISSENNLFIYNLMITKHVFLQKNGNYQKKKRKKIYTKKNTTLSEQFRNSKHTKSTKLRLHTTVVD